MTELVTVVSCYTSLFSGFKKGRLISFAHIIVLQFPYFCKYTINYIYTWFFFQSTRCKLWICELSVQFLLGRVMEFKMVPVIVAYTTLLIVLFFICIPLAKHYKKNHPKWMVFGVVGFLCVYGVYNFTNRAIFYNYNTIMMIVDTLWGFLSFMFLGYLHDLLVETVSFWEMIKNIRHNILWYRFNKIVSVSNPSNQRKLCNVDVVLFQ